MKPLTSIGATVAIIVGVAVALFAIQRVQPFAPDRTGDSYYTLSGAGIDLGPAKGATAQLGQPAPDFTLLDLNGSPVSLSNLRGQTVLINFWASWCLPCRREMPDLEDAFMARHGIGLTILAVNLQEGPQPARDFAEKYGVTFPVLLDSRGEVAKSYRLTGLPESWVVDGDGILREHKIGAFSQRELTAMLDDVMNRASVQHSRSMIIFTDLASSSIALLSSEALTPPQSVTTTPLEQKRGA